MGLSSEVNHFIRLFSPVNCTSTNHTITAEGGCVAETASAVSVHYLLTSLGSFSLPICIKMAVKFKYLHTHTHTHTQIFKQTNRMHLAPVTFFFNLDTFHPLYETFNEMTVFFK